MTISKVVNVLRQYLMWRRTRDMADRTLPPDQKDLDTAINIAATILEKEITL